MIPYCEQWSLAKHIEFVWNMNVGGEKEDREICWKGVVSCVNVNCL